VSFRGRLLLVSLATLAVGLGALVVAGNVLFAVRARAEASSVLRARADAQLAALTVDGGRVGVHESPNDVVLDRQSWVFQGDRVIERPANVAAPLDRAAVALGRAGQTAESDGYDDIRLRAQPVVDGGRTVGAVVVGYSVEALEALQQEVFVGSLIVAALVLLAGWFAVRSAVDGALKPVARMTSEAEDWGAHDLERRFELGPARDELTGLAATLDGLLARIAASRRHEQRFAGDVAHELRTPVAALRGRAELALGASGPDADEEHVHALQAVIAQARRLDATIDALLAVARQELDPASGSVGLEPLATEFEGVQVSAPADLPPAEGEPEIVRRALAPLVDNARRHARSQVTIELSAAGGRVRATVRDDGDGLDPELAARVFDPGVRGPAESGGGAGLGLPLARRLARSCGGDVVAGPGPGGCFVLELPAAVR
jgi:signal transduction histidine kinase